MDEEAGAEELRGMLRLRRAEPEAAVADARARLVQVGGPRLRAIESEGHMPTDDVVLGRVPAVRVAELTATAADFGPEHIGPVISPRGRKDLPPPQAEMAEGPRWSRPVARDWAEQYRRTHGPEELLSATTAFGTEQPRGLVEDHTRLTKITADSLEDAEASEKNRLFTRGSSTRREEQAAHLAWWPAVAINDGTNGFIPLDAVRTTIIGAVLGGLARAAEDLDDSEDVLLGDIRSDVVHLIDWYIPREPRLAPALFGEILPGRSCALRTRPQRRRRPSTTLPPPRQRPRPPDPQCPSRPGAPALRAIPRWTMTIPVMTDAEVADWLTAMAAGKI
ncbi:hypothetical protein QFZ63_000433 [Streptomyces sp. B3I7]|nr:hypothetical protein [Streptomyces sp. B3I7]